MKVYVTDFEFPDVETEREVFRAAGIELLERQCRSEEEVIRECADADALLVQWAPITARVAEQLSNCRVVVRYGIGHDNLAKEALAEHGIAACNVPDYATGEVCDHALALALALSRQLPLIDGRLRRGTWEVVPDHPMAAFNEMRFVTLGFGRIARGVLERAAPFGFRLAACDPFVEPETMQAAGVEPLSLEEAIRTADILSLHLPLTEETRHVIDGPRIAAMKRSAILVNTARGPLIDTQALAEALQDGQLLGAGLDVFETEPLERDHPILSAPRTLLTSHIAWHSSASIRRLKRMAAEEALRGLRGEPLRSQVNQTE